MVGTEAELREQRADLGRRPIGHPVLEAVDESLRTGEFRSGLVDFADRDTRPQTRPPLVGLPAPQ